MLAQPVDSVDHSTTTPSTTATTSDHAPPSASVGTVRDYLAARRQRRDQRRDQRRADRLTQATSARDGDVADGRSSPSADDEHLSMRERMIAARNRANRQRGDGDRHVAPPPPETGVSAGGDPRHLHRGHRAGGRGRRFRDGRGGGYRGGFSDQP